MAEGFFKVTIDGVSKNLVQGEQGNWSITMPSSDASMVEILFKDGEDIFHITSEEFSRYDNSAGYIIQSNGETWIGVTCNSTSLYGREITIVPIWNKNIFTVNLNGGTGGGYTSNYNVVLGYGATHQLPALTKSGYRYTGWNVTKNNDIRPADGKYNSTSKIFTQGYGIYTATAQYVTDTGEDPISGTYQSFSNSYNEINGSASGGNYRVAIGYDLILDNETVTINWTAYAQMKSNWQWGLAIQCEGQTGTGVLLTSPGTTYKNVASVSGSKTIQRSSTDTTTSLTAKAYGTTVSGYGGAPGSVELTINIDIPALDPYRNLTIYGCINSPIYHLLEIGETRSIQLMPEEQFYTVDAFEIWTDGNFIDVAIVNDMLESTYVIEWNGSDYGEIIYDENTNILTFTQGFGNIEMNVCWRAPTIGENQNVYIYLEEGKIYARNFVTSEDYYIDNDGTIYAPSFNVGDSLYLDENGITAKQFVLGIPS